MPHLLACILAAVGMTGGAEGEKEAVHCQGRKRKGVRLALVKETENKTSPHFPVLLTY